MSNAVKLERHGAVAVLRLDDPAAMNALSPSIKAGMQENVPKVLGDTSDRFARKREAGIRPAARRRQIGLCDVDRGTDHCDTGAGGRKPRERFGLC